MSIQGHSSSKQTPAKKQPVVQKAPKSMGSNALAQTKAQTSQGSSGSLTAIPDVIGNALDATGSDTMLGKINQPISAVNDIYSGVNDVFDGSKSWDERANGGLSATSAGYDLAESAQDFGGTKAGGWMSRQGSRMGKVISGASNAIGDSRLGQSAFGRGVKNFGTKAGGLVDDFGYMAAGGMNKVADGASNLFNKGAQHLPNSLRRQGTQSAIKTMSTLGDDGAKAALRTAGKGGATALGKAGGRFIPGMNVAMAALDAKHFYDVMNDPKASKTDKWLAGITAGGSALSATNIPILSQIGAGVSTVSSLIEAVGPEVVGEKLGQAKDWAMEKGGQAKDWAMEKGGQAKDWAVDKAGQAKDWVGEKAGQAKDWAGDKLNDASAWAGGKVAGAKEWAGNASDKAGAAMSSLWKGGKSLAGGAKKKLSGMASSVAGGFKKLTSGW